MTPADGEPGLDAAAPPDPLHVYARTAFETAACRVTDWPLPDEPFVTAWRRYGAAAGERGVAAVLQEVFVQLHFAIAPGMSQTTAYQQAVRFGIVDRGPGAGCVFEAPDAMRLHLHATAAGAIPVIQTGTRADFETLVCAITRRNEPADIPPSMGATMVAGYNNWERVRTLRADWAAARGDDNPDAWRAEFRTRIPQKHLYQDRFVLVSPGPYSGVSARALQLDPEPWHRLSLVIRTEHEAAHCFTRRVLGCMRDTLHDELLADYAGLVAAVGAFPADWFLHFLGLERHPAYRSGGRLENYGRDLSLPPAATATSERAVHRRVAQRTLRVR